MRKLFLIMFLGYISISGLCAKETMFSVCANFKDNEINISKVTEEFNKRELYLKKNPNFEFKPQPLPTNIYDYIQSYNSSSFIYYANNFSGYTDVINASIASFYGYVKHDFKKAYCYYLNIYKKNNPKIQTDLYLMAIKNDINSAIFSHEVKMSLINHIENQFNNPLAIYLIATIYKNGIPNMIIPNIKKAILLYRKLLDDKNLITKSLEAKVINQLYNLDTDRALEYQQIFFKYHSYLCNKYNKKDNRLSLLYEEYSNICLNVM